VWAIAGRNGSGKTTLLRTWLGLIAPVHGTVTIDGQDIHQSSTRERAKRVAYVPQREPDGLDLTAYEFVATARFARSRGLWEDAEDRRAITSALEWASVGSVAKPVSQYSGGERQRLTLARALAQETPVVLMDEPGTHLDPSQSRRLGEAVLQLASAGKTIAVVSHDIQWCRRYASHGVLIAETVITGLVEECFAEANLDQAFA
jgi:iron complex transport system ATP-binding protein